MGDIATWCCLFGGWHCTGQRGVGSLPFTAWDLEQVAASPQQGKLLRNEKINQHVIALQHIHSKL